MSNFVYDLFPPSRYTRIMLFSLGVFSVLMLNSCTAYRAERLKNKSYKAWQEQQLEQEKQGEVADKLSDQLK